MLNVRLAGGHLYGKQLFTRLSLVVSLMASLCAVLFPTWCLGWDLGRNESVSEGFLTYSQVHCHNCCFQKKNYTHSSDFVLLTDFSYDSIRIFSATISWTKPQFRNFGPRSSSHCYFRKTIFIMVLASFLWTDFDTNVTVYGTIVCVLAL